MFKKRDMIIIVCTISVVVMGLVFWKTFSCKKQDKLSSIVRAYQLPNGMFCDTLATDEEIDTFSTCYMNKIHRVLDIKDTTQIKEKIELRKNARFKNLIFDVYFSRKQNPTAIPAKIKKTVPIIFMILFHSL